MASKTGSHLSVESAIIRQMPARKNHKGVRIMAKNTHMGSSFDEFLKEDGTYAEVTAQSIKRA